MNQKGNEPMMMLHARIPLELMEYIENASSQAGISKSEYIRIALEFVRDSNLQVVKSVSFLKR